MLSVSKKQTIYITLIIFFGLVLHLVAINYALPIRFFADEYVHVANSLKMMDQTTLFLNFSYLPPLFAYLLMPLILLYGLGGIFFGVFQGLDGFKEHVILHSENLLVFSRFIVAIFSGLTVLVMFKWVKELFNVRVAYWSAILLTILPLYLIESQAGRFWLPVSFFILASGYFLHKLAQTSEFKWYIWTSIMIGLGYGMGFVSVAVIPWFILIHFFVTKKKGERFLNAKLTVSLILLMCLVVFFSLANTYSFLRQFGRGFGTILTIFGVTINVPQSSPQFIDNNFFQVILKELGVIWTNFYSQIILIFIGLGLLIKKSEFWRDSRNYFLVGFPIVYLIGVAVVFNNIVGRYLLPPLFIFTVAAAYAIDWLTVKLKQKKLLLLLLLMFFLLPQVYFIFSYSTKLLRVNTYIQAKNWIEQNVPTGSSIAILGGEALYLTADKISLARQKEHNPLFFDKRSQLLIDLADQRYPQPNYNVFYLSRLKLSKMVQENFNPEYCVMAYWVSWQDINFESIKLLEKYDFQLVKHFYPTKAKYDDLAIDTIHNSTNNGLEILNLIERLGPKIEIYKLNKVSAVD